MSLGLGNDTNLAEGTGLGRLSGRLGHLVAGNCPYLALVLDLADAAWPHPKASPADPTAPASALPPAPAPGSRKAGLGELLARLVADLWLTPFVEPGLEGAGERFPRPLKDKYEPPNELQVCQGAGPK